MFVFFLPVDIQKKKKEAQPVSVPFPHSRYSYVLQGASLRGRRRPPATLALEEKVHVELREADRRSMIEHTLVCFYDCCIVANWRLDNAKIHMPYALVRTYPRWGTDFPLSICCMICTWYVRTRKHGMAQRHSTAALQKL